MAADCEPGVPTLTIIGQVVNLFAGAALHFPASLSPAREAVAV
jgi:uroporphyrin-III C-methyltransferase